MAQTYTDAYVTIVASASMNADDGFLEQPESGESCQTLPFRVSPNQFGSVGVRISLTVDRQQPIDERAWTLQEHLLARRLLLYTSRTLQWRCATVTQNLGSSLHVEWTRIQKMKLLSQLSGSPKKAYDEWSRLVELYCHRVASVKSDKLPPSRLWLNDSLQCSDTIMPVYGSMLSSTSWVGQQMLLLSPSYISPSHIGVLTEYHPGPGPLSTRRQGLLQPERSKKSVAPFFLQTSC
jgi:hypothetical protein